MNELGVPQRLQTLVGLAAHQHGAVSRRQALDAGLSSSAIARQLDAGTWRAVEDGVYVTKGTRSSWLQTIAVACLAKRAIASHLTAGRLWKLALPKRPPGRIDVIVEAARRPRSTRAITVHRARADVAAWRVTVQGVPAADLGPTLIQLGEVLPPKALEHAVDSASAQRPGVLFWLADTLVDSRRGHGSSLKFRSLLSDLLSDGTLDADVDALLKGARLPAPVRGYQGLDFAWLGEKVALQTFDHKDNGLGAGLDALTQQGWRVLITHEREVKTRPRALLARLRAVL